MSTLWQACKETANRWFTKSTHQRLKVLTGRRSYLFWMSAITCEYVFPRTLSPFTFTSRSPAKHRRITRFICRPVCWPLPSQAGVTEVNLAKETLSRDVFPRQLSKLQIQGCKTDLCQLTEKNPCSEFFYLCSNSQGVSNFNTTKNMQAKH